MGPSASSPSATRCAEGQSPRARAASGLPTSAFSPPTSDFERQASSFELQISKFKPQTSNFKPRRRLAQHPECIGGRPHHPYHNWHHAGGREVTLRNPSDDSEDSVLRPRNFRREGQSVHLVRSLVGKSQSLVLELRLCQLARKSGDGRRFATRKSS